MKIKLLRTAVISHKPGEVVETSPDRARTLIAAGAAVEVKTQPPKKPAKKTE